MNLVCVIGEQREPDVVVLGHGPTEPASVDVTHVEIFKVTTFPTGYNWHGNAPLRCE
jgi:hypothetical protein